MRSFHEAQCHTMLWRAPVTKITTLIPNSSVVTLTYDPEHLPPGGRLCHGDFQRFMKRLRINRSRDASPRYFMAGEYGGQSARPHFHVILFGESFEDRYESVDRNGQVQQHSYELDKLWSQIPREGGRPTNIGRATVDDFSFAGAAYVAGYVAKKSNAEGPTGPCVEEVDEVTGEVRTVHPFPEYRKMSTHPGLGHDWLLKGENLVRVFEEDTIRISAWTFHPPRYYDTLLARHRPELVEEVKAKRLVGMAEYAANWSIERCAAAERIALESLQRRRDSL